MTWDDAVLNYHARLVAVREARFYRLLMRDLPGWQEALAAYHAAQDAYLAALQEFGR